MKTVKKRRYTDKELERFKNIIIKKIDKAKQDLDLLRSAYMNDSDNGTDDTSPTFKAFEEGSETMSKEANTQLALRQEKFIRDLKNALIRIENTLSIEAKNMQN
jgi:DnaK suppressor protein